MVLVAFRPASAVDPAALAAAEQAVRSLEAAGAETGDYVIRLSELGRLYRSHGEPIRAGLTLDKAVAQSEAIFGPEHVETAAVLTNRAEAALDAGDLATARQMHERALRIREAALGKAHPLTARSLNNLGLALLEAAEPRQAEEVLARALVINEKEFGKENRATAVSLVNLGRALLAQKKAAAAAECFRRARDIRATAGGDRDPGAVLCERWLAEALIQEGDVAGAEQLLDEVWASLRESLGEYHPDTLEAIDLLERASRLLDAELAGKVRPEPRARQRRFFVRDLLGVDWRDQFVSFPVAAAAGECTPGSVRLVGPAGPVAMQLVGVKTWPDGSLREARLCFYVDLAAFHSDLYVLQLDVQAAEAVAAPVGLAIDKAADRLIVKGASIGAEFSLVSAASGDIPPPMTAMFGADGGRFGGSGFYGPARVTGVEAAVLEAGPVLVEVSWKYACQGGMAYELKAAFGARDTAVHWEMQVTGDALTSGWQLRLNEGGDPLTFRFQKKAFSAYGDDPAIDAAGELDWVRRPLDSRMTAICLAPWFQQYFDNQQTLILLESAKASQTRFVLLRNPGEWVEPRWPRRFGEGYPGRLAKAMPLEVADDGAAALLAHCGTSLGGGRRSWAVGVARPDQLAAIDSLIEKTKDMPASMALGKWLEPRLCDLLDSRRLDRIKGFVLQWPRKGPRPRLFVTSPQLAEARARRLPLPGPAQAPQFPTFESFGDHLAATGDGPWFEPWHADAFAEVAYLRGDKTAAEMRIRDRAVQHLGLLGEIDRMRDAGIVAELYDGTVSTSAISRAEARVFDAWMAYLCHVYADPNVISCERGYQPGPPNITIAYVLSLGVCACAIPDHPQARGWARDVLRKVRFWLDEELGPEGEWFEGAHYDHVTLAQFIAFAIAMRNAGFGDLTADARLRQFADSLAQQATPPDPFRQGLRVTPPLGRRVAGLTWSLSGLMSRMSAESDPAYSARMQWAWQAAGHSYRFPDDRLGGMEMLLLDPALPASRPAWKSREFPRSGVILRDAVGTAEESYLLVPTHWNEAMAPFQVGAVVKWFAGGAPLGGAFSDGDLDRHQLLGSHVLPAFAPQDADEWQRRAKLFTKGTVNAAIMQPLADYIDASFTTPFPPFQGGAEAATPGGEMPPSMPRWPTVDRAGEGPIDWRRQILFVKASADGAPAYMVMRDTVLSDTPTTWLFWTLTRGLGRTGTPLPDLGAEVRAATPLEGDRFSARGQFGIDLDFFVAAPQDSPRHTLRWGRRQENPPPAIDEYQDLLHLQLAGKGGYLVFLCPRPRERKPPSFETLAPGVVRVQGDWGEDIVFLDTKDVAYRQDGIAINAPAGLIRRNRSTDSICLVAGGTCSTPKATSAGNAPGGPAGVKP